jgi:hypothetical protein
MKSTHPVNAPIFKVETNAQAARQILNTYYQTPDSSGKIYASFPEFFLIKPELMDERLYGSEKQLIDDCKAKAFTRSGYIGISKYFDTKFGYHWIKLLPYPFMLGDDVGAECKHEFFYLMSKFIAFTKENPSVYGDLTAAASSDNDVALMLNAIEKNAAELSNKLQYYSETLLVSYDPTWPASELKKLLVALEKNEQSWNHLFLEHLRYVMRQSKGLTQKNVSTNAIPLKPIPSAVALLKPDELASLGGNQTFNSLEASAAVKTEPPSPPLILSQDSSVAESAVVKEVISEDEWIAKTLRIPAYPSFPNAETLAANTQNTQAVHVDVREPDAEVREPSSEDTELYTEAENLLTKEWHPLGNNDLESEFVLANDFVMPLELHEAVDEHHEFLAKPVSNTSNNRLKFKQFLAMMFLLGLGGVSGYLIGESQSVEKSRSQDVSGVISVIKNNTVVESGASSQVQATAHSVEMVGVPIEGLKMDYILMDRTKH